ncbi:SH3 domain-containing protein [Lentilactobacillus hilgardii]|nr:SH3 domain-containing protein [Lentilactobacillus hilgardii]MCV3741251.1 SH3 domain-containing protein [Lentilactobacillus hilgardii]
MDTTAAQNTPDGYTISESGKFTFNTKCKIRHTPVMSDTGIGDDVTSGQEVGYTGKEKNDNHFWITYTGADSSTLYVPYANITNNTYFGTDSNSDDPIQVSTGGDTGSGSGDTGSGSGSGDTGSGSTTASTDPDAPGAKFRLLNLPLPNQAAQQCFTVFYSF